MDSKEFKNLGDDLDTSDNENVVESVNLPMVIDIIEENESVQESGSPSEEATISTVYVAEHTEHTNTPNTKCEKLNTHEKIEESEERDGGEKEEHGNKSNEIDELIQMKKTKEIKDKERERDIRSAPLSIPYFKLPKSSYLEFSEKVSKKLTTNTTERERGPITHTRINNEISILEEIANETAEHTIELDPNFTEEKLCESPSDDDDIVILDVIPSPHGGAKPGTSSSAKGFCLHSASKKSCKPNLNFAGEVGLKMSVGQSATSQKSEVPGAKWHYWKKELKKRMDEKKEENFKRKKEIERIDDEEVFSEDEEGTIECEKNTVGYKERETGDEDTSDWEEIGEECEREEEDSSDGYKSEESINGDCEDKFSINGESEDSLSQFSEATVTDSERSVADEVDKGEFLRRSQAEDHSQICFSMPSHQPNGGFPELEDAVEASPYMKDTVITLSSDSSAASNLFVQENNFCMSSQENEIPTPASFVVVDEEKEGRQIIHTFDDDSILGICSGVFPSTNGVLPSTLVSVQTQRSFSSENIDSEAESQDSFTEAPESIIVKKRRVVISDTEEENSLSESEKDDVESFSIYKKKKTTFNLSDDSEDDAVAGGERNFPFTKDIPDTNLMDAKKRNLIQDFIENEAELSGEEASSDEDEVNLDIEEEMEDFFEDVPQNYEKLRNQIGQIHLKQIQDADDNFLKRIKNDFLDEGELHAESGERKKQFSWASKDLAGETIEAITLSDSDEDNVEHFNQEDKLKWKKEADNLPDESTHENSPRSASLKMNIIGKSNVCMSELKVDHSLKRKRGSLMHSEGLKVKKLREETPVGGGSRKQVFFIKSDHDNPKPSTSKDKGKKADSVIFEKIFKN